MHTSPLTSTNPQERGASETSAVTSTLQAGPVQDPGLEAMPPEAASIFGPQLDQARCYAELLAGRGRLFGVIGPREASRMWSRHLINSASIAPLIADGVILADIGSGAGLPGIPLALARPDLRVRLVESLSRRVRFLHVAVDELGLADRVEVVHARAETLPPSFADVCTARAVASIPNLIAWCLPLVPRNGGQLLALRGETAPAELSESASAIRLARASGELLEIAAASSEPPTRVIRIVRQ